jgi:ketosteroid isomerase-like protein
VALAVHVIIRGVTRDQYDAVRAADGWLDNPPHGGLSHLTWWDGADCHNMDAWESKANFEAFAATRLGPAMAKAGVTAEPEISYYEAHEVYLPQARTIAPSASIDLAAADDVATMRGAYAAFATGDINAVLAAFAEDIVWTTPDTLPFGGTYRGRGGVGEFFSHLGENYSELRVEPDSYVTTGNQVVVLGHHRGRSVSGNSFEMPFAHAWTMKDGKAATFTEFFDTAKMQVALGELATA